MTSRSTRNRRLRAAGYVAVRVGDIEGHVPAAIAQGLEAAIEAHKAKAAAIADEPQPRGNPAWIGRKD